MFILSAGSTFFGMAYLGPLGLDAQGFIQPLGLVIYATTAFFDTIAFRLVNSMVMRGRIGV